MALNRAVAVAEVDGPEVALALVTDLHLKTSTSFMPSAPTCCAGSAATTRRRWPTEAAIDRAKNAAERDFLERRLRAVSAH